MPLIEQSGAPVPGLRRDETPGAGDAPAPPPGAASRMNPNVAQGDFFLPITRCHHPEVEKQLRIRFECGRMRA